MVKERLKGGQFVDEERLQRMVNLWIKKGQWVVMKYLGNAHKSLSQRAVRRILALGSKALGQNCALRVAIS